MDFSNISCKIGGKIGGNIGGNILGLYYCLIGNIYPIPYLIAYKYGYISTF